MYDYTLFLIPQVCRYSSPKNKDSFLSSVDIKDDILRNVSVSQWKSVWFPTFLRIFGVCQKKEMHTILERHKGE